MKASLTNFEQMLLGEIDKEMLNLAQVQKNLNIVKNHFMKYKEAILA